MRYDEKTGLISVSLGKLDQPNRTGVVYGTQTVRALLPDLKERVKHGMLRCEYGFPQKTPGQSHDDLVRRYATIEEERVCAMFVDLGLEVGIEAITNPPIHLMAKIRPWGPFGDTLREVLEDPTSQLNWYFGARAFSTDTHRDGAVEKQLYRFITWDFITH
ncbi:S80 family phage morphogenetic serine protease [Paraburkholderia sp. BCC1886]|uniref:S80 family phage morphogenetic serine protease n=1 Tax=Paraburkholderia sp. BCC1886 TaxID=2562670 RepID=UPI001183B86F|nr:S80 family phage morphogenetic serine protease [Paraburkholderia sp. BCC1886]